VRVYQLLLYLHRAIGAYFPWAAQRFRIRAVANNKGTHPNTAADLEKIADFPIAHMIHGL